MQIDLFDINKYIERYGCKEVTSSNIFSAKLTEPDPEGLGSYEIFGHPGSQARRETFGYISLHAKFVHPHVYNVLCSLSRAIQDLIFGEAKFYLEDGKLKRYNEGEKLPAKIPVGTGVDFLYLIYDKLDWESASSTSNARNMRVQLLKSLKKEEVFVDKVLVIPPFYRDVDMVKGSKNEINIMYSRILNMASMIRSSSGLFELQGITESHKGIQRSLNEIYDYFIGFVAGVHGFMHEHVMGKTTDYSARCVISTASLNEERAEDMEVTFHKSALPLAIAIKCFAPYIAHGVKNIVEQAMSGSKFINVIENGKTTRKALADHWEEAISSNYIYKLIEIYYNSREHRLDPYTVECADGTKVPLYYLSSDYDLLGAGKEIDPSVLLSSIKFEPLNLTQLFYMAAMQTIQEKVVLITRYPIEDYHNIYPSRFNIMPCTKTVTKTIDGVLYPRWPDLSGATINNADKFFVDTLRIFPTYLKALGGDFDGDMVSVQGLFAEESVNEGIAYTHSVTNVVSIEGGTMRTILDLSQHTLFGLTAGPNY